MFVFLTDTGRLPRQKLQHFDFWRQPLAYLFFIRLSRLSF
jgi:hypothetical protein